MKRFSLASLVLLTILGFGFAFFARPTAAQDNNMMGTVVCDGDLILSLYFAENNYDFGAVYDQLMMDMPDMAMPGLDVFDTGQYAPLFESMMMMMDDNMGMADSMMSEDMMTSVMDMMGSDNMMSDDMNGDMTTLTALTVDGEPAECASLRAELHKFYDAVAVSSMAMEHGQ